MKASFISTVLGQDSPGIISKIAQTTRKLGGEWKVSKAIKLGGQFIAMMEVNIDSANEAELKAELESEFPQLTFVYAAETAQTGEKLIRLEIDCPDRPGLTKEITAAIENLNVTIDQFEFNRYPVTDMNANVFSAKVTVAVGEATRADHIADELEALDNRLKVIVL